MDDFSYKNRNEYFKPGWLGGGFFIILNLLKLLLGTSFIDWVILIVSFPIYYIVSRSAASQRYRDQQTDPDPLEGVTSTAFGAVFITLCISIGSMIVIMVIVSLFSRSFDVSFITLCWNVPSQIVISLIMNAISNSIFYKQNRFDTFS